ncbi:MAG: PucR family transcriptional regulator, purine catabolism regulatory protein [Thermoanaerobacteraceae bacterium]|nr:PucR family transcriptional regulator, purine catabolism regulatory protein [Thermoanaerobacteraceae bacterium]
MGITVREALRIGELKNAKVIAGEKGLDRIVNYVITMDVPDAAKWIRGNELLLTAAYVFMNNPDMEKTFVYDLVERNCSALAIKPGRFIDKIPPQIIEPANEKNFPIIELPVYVAWHDIVNPIMLEILNKEAGIIKRSFEIHDELMKVALQGGDLAAVAGTLSYLLNCNVFIEDESFNLLSFSNCRGACDALSLEIIKNGRIPLDVIEEMDKKGIFKKIKTFKKPVRVNLRSRDNCYTRVIAPIIIKGEICGYITLIENDSRFGDFDLIAAEQAATIAALEIMKKQAVKQAEGKVKREFFENILAGNINDASQIKSRLKYYGVNFKGDIAVIVIHMNYESALKAEEEDFKGFESVMAPLSHVILRKGEDIIIICSFSDVRTIGKYDEINILCKNISKSLGGIKEIRFGISDFHDDVAKISEGYIEAKRSLELADMLKNGTGSIVFYKDVWIYDFILSCKENENLKKFCDRRLLKLIEYDSKNKEENLLNTLRVYLDCTGKQNMAAEKLFIHRNTLNYRLNKIRGILDCDLNDPSTRLRLEISLKIVNLLNKRIFDS